MECSKVRSKGRKLFRRLTSSILSLVFVLNLVSPMLQYSEVNAADNANWRGVFETSANLVDGKYNTSGSGTVGYINFGKRPAITYSALVMSDDGKSSTENKTIPAGTVKWLITGKETDGNIVIFSEKPLMGKIPFDNSSDQYRSSNLRKQLQNIQSSSDYFKAAEQGLMLDTTVTTQCINASSYTTTDKLYALYANKKGDTTVYAGTSNSLPVSTQYYFSGAFMSGGWVRSPNLDDPYPKNPFSAINIDDSLMYATSGGVAGGFLEIGKKANFKNFVMGAVKLNLQHILFAANAAISTAATGNSFTPLSTPDNTFNLRVAGGSMGGTVSANGNKITYKANTDERLVVLIQSTGGGATYQYVKDGTGASETLTLSTLGGLTEGATYSAKAWTEKKASCGNAPMYYASTPAQFTFMSTVDPTIKSTSTSITYAPGLKLSQVPFPSTDGNTQGSWSWEAPNTAVGNAGSHTFNAVYTPKDTSTYNIVTRPVTVTVNKAETTIKSTSTSVIYEPNLKLSGVTPPSTSGNTAGKWSWEAPNTAVGNVGEHNFNAVYTPTDTTNYNSSTKSITVTVNPKAASDPGTPNAGTVTYSPSQTLANITPPSGWSWANSSEVPVATKSSYTAYYAVSDYTNYDWSKISGYEPSNHRVKRDLTLKVNKANPSKYPTDLTAIWGQILNDLKLPVLEEGAWTWVSPGTSVGDAGQTYKYPSKFIPNDGDNYSIVPSDVNVTVNKAMPSSPEGLTAIYGQKLSDVAFTQPNIGTWTWQNPDTVLDKIGSQVFLAKFESISDNYLDVDNVGVDIYVNRKPIDSADITVQGLEKEYEYNGRPSSVQPKVKVFDGETELTEGTDYEVAYNDSEWSDETNLAVGSITINGLGNYDEFKKLTFNIKDKVVPSGKIVVENDKSMTFSLFNTDVSYQYMFDSEKKVTIEALDNESGIKDVYYHISEENLCPTKSGNESYTDDEIEKAISADGAEGWQKYGNEITLKKATKNIIYAKIVDKNDNVKYINTQGIVVYDNVDLKDKAEYTKTTNDDTIISDNLNGNSVTEVYNGETKLEKNVHYDIVGSDGGEAIKIKGTYLNTLAPSDGGYIFKVSFNPMGEEFDEKFVRGDKPSDITTTVYVRRADLVANDFTFTAPDNLVYDGKGKEASVVYNNQFTGGGGEIAVQYYDSTGSKMTELPTVVGKYVVKISTSETDSYNALSDFTVSGWEFEITKATPNLKAPQVGQITYEPTATLDEILIENPPENLPGKWTWSNINTTPTVNKDKYEAVFDPDDKENYDWTKVSGDASYKNDKIVCDIDIEVLQNDLSSKTDVTGNDTVIYNTNDQTPKPIVKYGDTLLIEGKDYTISWSGERYDEKTGCTNAGTYTGTIDFIGNYSGQTTISFTIEKATPSITTPTVDGITYDPEKTLETITIANPEGNLSGKWTWVNPETVPSVDIAQYEAQFDPADKENYDWENVVDGEYRDGKVVRKIGLNVERNEITDGENLDISGYNENINYDPDGQTPKPIVKYGDTPLIEGKDYTISWSGEKYDEKTGCTNAGTYTGTIDFIGNYSGQTTISFTIEKATPSITTPTVDGITYDPEKTLGTITIANPEGNPGGDWTWVNPETVPTVDIAQYEAQFDPEDKENYDWENVVDGEYRDGKVVRKVKLKVDVDKSTWGKEVDSGGVINYVSEDGTTSSEVDNNGMIWLREESGGTSNWYAIDNTDGIFRRGSRFWVRWLNEEENSEEWQRYYSELDDDHKRLADSKKLWIFLTGVTDLDGNECKVFGKELPYYIQLGEDWDEDDINAVFISRGTDEILDVSYINQMNSPEGRFGFAKLTLKHFSPYAIYDELTDAERETVYTQKNSKTSNAQTAHVRTGDELYLALLDTALLVIVSGVSALVLKKKRDKGK